MNARTSLYAIAAFLTATCWLLNSATADEHVRYPQFHSSSDDGNALPSPIDIHFKLSESIVLQETNGKRPRGSTETQYVESSVTVDTDGLNLIELTLEGGRKVAFEFRVQRPANERSKANGEIEGTLGDAAQPIVPVKQFRVLDLPARFKLQDPLQPGSAPLSFIGAQHF